jgi:hypothetical protein
MMVARTDAEAFSLGFGNPLPLSVVNDLPGGVLRFGGQLGLSVAIKKKSKWAETGSVS